MNTLLLFVVLTGNNVIALGDDSFFIRQKAQKKLEYCREISIPALLFGMCGNDLERKIRSKQVYNKIVTPWWYHRKMDMITWWLFYGPDQLERHNLHRRLLDIDSWEYIYLRSCSDDDKSQIVIRAIRWKLSDEIPDYYFIDYVNKMRCRARGIIQNP